MAASRISIAPASNLAVVLNWPMTPEPRIVGVNGLIELLSGAKGSSELPA